MRSRKSATLLRDKMIRDRENLYVKNFSDFSIPTYDFSSTKFDCRLRRWNPNHRLSTFEKTGRHLENVWKKFVSGNYSESLMSKSFT